MVFNVLEKDAELFRLKGPCPKAAKNKGLNKPKKMYLLTSGNCEVCQTDLDKKKFS